MMRSLDKETFVCLDCETTGLNPKSDRIIEVAVAVFRGEEILEEFETLVDPGIPISEESSKIHHITDMMVKGKPSIESVLPRVIELGRGQTIVGHGIGFDLAILKESAMRANLALPLGEKVIDTFRLARLYGESPTNSLDQLRHHFNIQALGAHRAWGDVVVNIQVFRYLVKKFKSEKDIFKALSKPILLKAMPLGKHKGRLFSDVPLNYLKWASFQEFDEDLLFSIRTELQKRKKDNTFSQSTSPFKDL